MKPKRLFQVYQEETAMIDVTSWAEMAMPNGARQYAIGLVGAWRFRILAPRAPVDRRIVGGSGEAFDSKSNAVRAARREVSLYPPGVAAVEIQE